MPANARILITGGNGRLAQRIARRLLSEGTAVTLAGRSLPDPAGLDVRSVAVGPVGGDTDWTDALRDATGVVHAGAMTRKGDGESDALFDVVNHQGTRALAGQAAAAGVRRFVQISSASIAGRVSPGRPLRVDDPPAPTGIYSQSKLAAEKALAEVAAATGLETVILRPPRIIGEPLGGNLALFERLIIRGIPLPFGSIAHNRRDNVSPASLVEMVVLALREPGAVGGTFYVTDDDPLSTRALVERIAARNGRRAILIPVPAAMLRAIIGVLPARFLGQLTRAEMTAELLDSFELDVEPAKRLLNWRARPGTL